MDYVVAAANLKAKIYNIPQSRDREVSELFNITAYEFGN